MKNAGSFCLVKNMTSHNKNLVFKPLFVNKSILFSSYFSCFKNEKERVFYRKKTWSCGEIITKNEGNWLRMIKKWCNTRYLIIEYASFLFVYLLDNNLLLVDLIFWIDLLRILCWLIDL